MDDKKILKQLTLSDNTRLERDIQVMKQLEEMKDQTAYMKEFRTALGSALDEVKTLRSELAHEKSKGWEVLQESHRRELLERQSIQKQENHLMQLSQPHSGDNEDLEMTCQTCKCIRFSENFVDFIGDIRDSPPYRNLRKPIFKFLTILFFYMIFH